MATYLFMVRPPRDSFPGDATPEERDVVGAHFRYLQQALAEGRLYLAGRRDDAKFGIGIFDADDDDSARRFIESDPAIASGVFTGEYWPFSIALMKGVEE